nr:MAG TPA: hypothetical protein [Caudoviricetes sp.]
MRTTPVWSFLGGIHLGEGPFFLVGMGWNSMM